MWIRSLPHSPPSVADADSPHKDSAISYGEYFTAIRRFIEQDRFSRLTGAVLKRTGESVTARDLKDIKITLEKHGQFYHPSRLAVTVGGRQVSFFVNLAVTPTGRTYLRADVENIRRLNRKFPYRFLPQVYASGKVVLSGPSHVVEIFLGQWLDGFHEFHLSGMPLEGNDCVLVWDPSRGAIRVSDNARREVYRQAAKILTAYYNLETFEQVFSWHHAAGDFIVSTEGQNVKVRLITIRKYAPLFEGTQADMETIIQALLVFLISLTIKMRLDRLDGVGALAWAEDAAVGATLRGVYDGLKLQVDNHRIPAELLDIVMAYLKSQTTGDLDEWLEAIYDRAFRQIPESNLILKNLRHHGQTLFKAIGHTLAE